MGTAEGHERLLAQQLSYLAAGGSINPLLAIIADDRLLVGLHARTVAVMIDRTAR